MRLSKRTEYGIKAAIHLTALTPHRFLQSREIAAAEHLPAKFLESILLALRSAGLLESKVGSGGGYRLARDPAAITIAEIVSALEPGAESDEPEPIDSPGAVGLATINQRLDAALETALGAFHLAQLAAIAEPAAARV